MYNKKYAVTAYPGWLNEHAPLNDENLLCCKDIKRMGSWLGVVVNRSGREWAAAMVRCSVLLAVASLLLSTLGEWNSGSPGQFFCTSKHDECWIYRMICSRKLRPIYSEFVNQEYVVVFEERCLNQEIGYCSNGIWIQWWRKIDIHKHVRLLTTTKDSKNGKRNRETEGGRLTTLHTL